MPEEEQTTPQETPTEELQEAKQDVEAELAKLRTENEQLKKGLSTSHQTLTQKDRDIKRLQDTDYQIKGLEDRIELLATAIAAQGLSTEEPANRSELVTQLKAQREKQEADRKAAQEAADRQTYLAQADVIYSEAREVFKDNEDELDKIEDQLMSMMPERMERARRKVERAKAAIKPKEEESVDVEKLKEEIKRQIMEENGLLVAETGTPGGAVSGTVIDWNDVREDQEAYKKAFPGGSADFNKALAEGRIKNI